MIATKKIEFGDFQTPSDLAQEIADFLRDSGETADAVVEPTCGRGSFVTAAIAAFPKAKVVYGFDINPQYVREAEDTAGRDVERIAHLECRNGFAAKTGKANFDISEWMLIRLLEALHQRSGCVAMLCKTGAARKTLRHAWLNSLNIGRCSLHSIDAQRHFGASVDACLLIAHTGMRESVATARVYPESLLQWEGCDHWSCGE
jgi:hypothetical protein